MGRNVSDKVKAREKRRRRVRRQIFGTPDRPRLSVFRSNKHIYAQLVDDASGKTLLSASSLDSDSSPKGKRKTGSNQETAATVGKMVAKKAISLKIKKIVFDRNGYLYHGRVKALADSARQGGLEF
jgi:large subunit ribosomal protein L18